MNKKLFVSVIFLVVTCLFSQSFSEITFKELTAAKQLYDSGNTEKALSIIEVLKNDKDKKLAEQAWYLKFILLSSQFTPVIYLTDPETSNISHYITEGTGELPKFKKKFPKSKFTPEIEKLLNENAKNFTFTYFNYINKPVINFSDSCMIEYGPDSTFSVRFENKFTDSLEHSVNISFTGKLTRYEPYGDMKDEWGSTGLLLDTKGSLLIELDGVIIKQLNNPVAIKQYPEYILRKVTKYGFTQDQTFIREDNALYEFPIAFKVNDRYLISYLDLKLLFGKMNELVPYYNDDPENTFPKNFKSKAYLSFSMIATKN
ncbi:TPA: hypothetical protein DCR49_12565 [Candidatus Delongbacteria bacterium]|nr:MAG: hypothetical protein A2Y39_06335 [Candidatus Delongbacteria bacterium GWF2_40_14]HAQ62800.1 hypothetical protein [Candidatus Delongbacteria bacterium]